MRLLEPQPVTFRCSCGRDRIVEMLRGLGEDETMSIVAEHGEVEVNCEFCGRTYRFDPVDARALFAAAPHAPVRSKH
ncbi:33 kDa chaperonin [compost metagenome]